MALWLPKLVALLLNSSTAFLVNLLTSLEVLLLMFVFGQFWLSIVSNWELNGIILCLQGGGFDKLILESLYDQGDYRQRQQQQLYGSSAPNPFMSNDPFVMSNQVAPPSSVQMAAMSQQHQQIPTMMQANPFGPPMQPQHVGMGPATNPFLDSGFGPFPMANNGHQQANPFGGTQLL